MRLALLPAIRILLVCACLGVLQFAVLPFTTPTGGAAWAKEKSPAGKTALAPPSDSDLDEAPAPQGGQPAPDPESLLNLVPAKAAVDKLLAAPPPAPHAAGIPAKDSTDSATLLKSILADPKYKDTKPPPGESWLDKLLAFLQRLMPKVTPKTPAWLAWVGSTAGLVIVGVLIVLLAYLLARLLWAMAARRRGRLAGNADSAPAPSRPEELLAQARAAGERGDYRAALRLRFRAVVARLDLPSSSLLTNSQLQRQLRREAPEAGGPFAELSACFEDVWYGGANCNEGLYRQADSLAQRIETALAAALTAASEAAR